MRRVHENDLHREVHEAEATKTSVHRTRQHATIVQSTTWNAYESCGSPYFHGLTMQDYYSLAQMVPGPDACDFARQHKNEQKSQLTLRLKIVN